MKEKAQTIAAVVVTFNRFELLKKCVQSLKNQTRRIDEILVINNNSTDGTLEWLNSQNALTVITQENSGSAGGQYTGIKTAYEKGYDWIWCLDTDVVVDSTALENFFLTKTIKDENLGFLSSTIFYSDGTLANINIPFLDNENNIVKTYIKNSELSIISSSFGSVLFPRKIISEIGLPMKDFFIWGDDVEYSFRIISAGYKGYLSRASTGTHHAPNNSATPFLELKIRSIKMKYGVRNTVILLIIRSQLIKNSKFRGYLSSLYFIIMVCLQRIKKNLIDLYGSLSNSNLIDLYGSLSNS